MDRALVDIPSSARALGELAARTRLLVATSGSGGRATRQRATRSRRIGTTSMQALGHLKRQPYGPGSKERKWIYVASREARRWGSPKLRTDKNWLSNEVTVMKASTLPELWEQHAAEESAMLRAALNQSGWNLT